MNIIPGSKPKLSKEEVEKIINHFGVDAKYKALIVAIRGYYLDSMGDKGVNDRALYDDAAFLISPQIFLPFNFNTDPSIYRRGSGFGSQKGVAVLKSNEVYYVHTLDKHKGQYLALCQRAGKVTVIRDPGYEDTGYFGINIHRGGNYVTSSEGCQTVPPPQWNEFISNSKAQMKLYSQTICPYILIDETLRRTL